VHQERVATQPALTVKGGGRLRVAALVRVHHEGDLAVLAPHIFRAGIKGQVQPFIRIELETPKDPASAVEV